MWFYSLGKYLLCTRLLYSNETKIKMKSEIRTRSQAEAVVSSMKETERNRERLGWGAGTCFNLKDSEPAAQSMRWRAVRAEGRPVGGKSLPVRALKDGKSFGWRVMKETRSHLFEKIGEIENVMGVLLGTVRGLNFILTAAGSQVKNGS